MRPRLWWEQGWAVAAIALLSAVPLIWPTVPPLTDLPGHMARYKVEMDLASSPELRQFYDFYWGLTANLGLDLLVIPLTRLIGLEPAVKAIMVCVPPLTVIGLLWTAHEVHGRIPPTAWFAVPLAYNFPLHFGFVNFTLAMALGILAFPLWLRLGKSGRVRLRAALFVPLSLIIWLAHAYGWGLLAVLVFCTELTRIRASEPRLLRAGFRAAIACLPLAPPALLMLVWRSGQQSGQTQEWFNLIVKINYLITLFRDRWRWLDLASLALLLTLLVAAFRNRRVEIAPQFRTAGILLTILYVLLPGRLFGSHYADMRLLPYALAALVVGIRIRDGEDKRLAPMLAIAALIFIGVRTSATTISFWRYGKAWDRELAALDHIPKGARLVSFAGSRCRGIWEMQRFDHLPGMAVVRRSAFSNDQWPIPGALLLSSHYRQAGDFIYDPSQIIGYTPCPGNRWRSIDRALREFPRDAFDYVWLIRPPAYDPALVRGMEPVWSDGPSIVYRILDHRQPPPRPSGYNG